MQVRMTNKTEGKESVLVYRFSLACIGLQFYLLHFTFMEAGRGGGVYREVK